MDAEADGGCLHNADWRGDRGRHASGAMCQELITVNWCGR